MRGALLSVGVAALVACGSDSEGDDGEAEKPALIVPDRSGATIQLNPEQLSVDRSFTLVASSSTEENRRSPFTGDFPDSRVDALYALDYPSGSSRLLMEEPTDGRFVEPLRLLRGGSTPYYLTRASSLDEVVVHEVDLTTNAVTEFAVGAAPERCEAVVGADFYFAFQADLQVSRGFATQTSPASTARLAEASNCGLSLYALDGFPVALDRVTGSGGEVFRLSLLDSGTGEPDAAPLAEIPLNTLATDARDPEFSVDSDGLWALSSDFVSLELWRASYAREPGSTGTVGEIDAPTRIGGFDSTFFEPFTLGGTISIESIFGFSVRDGVVAIGVEVVETSGGERFSFFALVIAEPSAGTADLIDLGGAVQGLELFP
ncbi:MAG: hypothetical protein AAFU77_06570 [Myxococcota bacterium]